MLEGGFFTELQVEIDYYVKHTIHSSSSKCQLEVLFQGDFVPVRLGSEIDLQPEVYDTNQNRFIFCGSSPHGTDIEEC